MNNIIFKDIEQTKQLNIELDLEHLIKEEHDILSFNYVKIDGQIDNFDEYVQINLDVDTKLIMACARTFKEVEVHLEFNIDAEFSNFVDLEFKLEDTLNLEEFVYSYILIEKPYVVYHESSNDEDFKENEKKVNPAFAALIDK